MKLEYFGTTLDSAGHYPYELDNGFHRSMLNISLLPFNPEGLPYKGDRMNCADGTVQFHQFCGFTILAIAGSCKDSRPGSKSIFFTIGTYGYQEFKEAVFQNKTAKTIIDKLRFKILWLDESAPAAALATDKDVEALAEKEVSRKFPLLDRVFKEQCIYCFIEGYGAAALPVQGYSLQDLKNAYVAGNGRGAYPITLGENPFPDLETFIAGYNAASQLK